MKILYSDKNIIVCIKPVGLDSEKQVPDKLKEEFSGKIFTIHRLDLNVSGVMVYARNKKTAADLSQAVQEGTMIKEYLAAVHGIPPESGDWEDLLFKDSRKNKVFVVKRERRGVKKARLEFKRISQDETSQVRIRLHTGRSHQIRVQFASRGFPLVGDHKYGSKDKQTLPMLFSCKLTFPYQGENVSFEALPEWYFDTREMTHMETYREFLDRINSFQHKELTLGNGDFQVNPGVLKKVDSNNDFSDFYGDTVVFDLDSTSKEKISTIVDKLYSKTEECFCQRLIPNTFHMTLHDLSNSPFFDEISDDMIKNEVLIKEKLGNKPIEKQTIRMKTNCIFNMVNTSIVLGLYPADETEYKKLMHLYNYVDGIKTLPYPLTPHITLAYYNRNGFSQDSSKRLENTVNQLNCEEFEITLSTDNLVYQNFINMNSYKNIFHFT